MYGILRKWLFSKDAEQSHDLTLGLLKRYANTPLAWFWRQQVEAKPVTVMGIEFPNPVGLAAGLDKNAECIDAFAQMGFGFIEVGTVTPKPQEGNPKPRLFRIPEREAIINRMGFNNLGVDYLVEQVQKAKFKGVLGINIGKNKATAEADAVHDYVHCMRKVYAFASYITVNISSPNTPGLRAYQHGDALHQLLASLKQTQAELATEHGRYVPLAVKIAPDLDNDGIAAMAAALIEHQIDAVIATNTTLSRDAVVGCKHADEAGGLSGKVLFDASTAVVKQLAEHLQGKLPIIAVGGIDSAAAAQAKLAAGASLVQVYTGFIYHGPQLIRTIVNDL
ncbi:MULTISPECIES: quinone-dependent dihydroorotate dehydrogenase [Idiomarina]|uniref:quinone-dependent dihydroorotate dehydrogenase n=1 Tax=Idiomarina TaxID=135575 RepID=UPI00129B432D|nr:MULTISPECIES: quinone-dependent dihydroorotate dehydrogenase [Idiomarina]MRJ40862.1 quinone-dependent dihydroorotate dehydrogenase [Idiomarina sp. FeN1]NCU56666.1 quinone-dependent dihydroorotate dehydrogenase [Idiomarina sp. FenA--70]NCU59046.1 quinone-dependent dihydroorotate dehydrogenase [Idiomarina sp. FenBw--71]UUN14460.1 quinone-dependent dihydroorotate dehydrogenase [Idiomarina loihiensis]